jgi:hypothetical protein
MKRILILSGVALALGLGFTSCKSNSTLVKDIKQMDIRFKPLTRADYTLVGNLQTESVVTGTQTKKGRALDPEFTQTVKKGLISKSEATEILYFAPAPGEAITGSLYENEIFNQVYGPSSGVATTKSALSRLRQRFAGAANIVQTDPGMDRAYYLLVEKFPDIDYFINVRFDRNVVVKGAKFTETIIIKADGVQLRTDD